MDAYIEAQKRLNMPLVNTLSRGDASLKVLKMGNYSPGQDILISVIKTTNKYGSLYMVVKSQMAYNESNQISINYTVINMYSLRVKALEDAKRVYDLELERIKNGL
jgi:hypothetical protein